MRALFLGPQECFPWDEKDFVLCSTEPDKELGLFDAVFVWREEGKHWVCVHNRLSELRPRLMPYYKAEGVRDLIAGGRCVSQS